jgi:YHYH protein/Putative Ig domain
MANYSGFATNLELGRLINVSTNWSFNTNVQIHTGDYEDVVNLTATGIPFHGYGSIYESTVSLAQYYNRQWVWRGGKNISANPQAVTSDVVGFWMNGVAIYPASIDSLPPFGFTTPAGFHFDQSYANGIAQNQIDDGQHWYKQDLAGGRATGTGRYFYSDYSFAPIWLSGQGGRPYSSTVHGLAEVNVIPYLSGGLFHPDGHSKILGFSVDGFPIYGPSGYINPIDNTSGVKNLSSGYALKPSSYRSSTTAYNLTLYPMGMFVEDYTYAGTGDLDTHNGRYCVTPDYPSGTYAYFCTVDNSGKPVYPYVIGQTFYNQVDVLTTEQAIGYGTEYPVWVTPKGNLGKVQSLQFFELGLQAVDPSGQPDGKDINYKLIAGKLPAGLQIDSSGQVTGNPKDTYSIDGVPEAVTQDRTSNFTVRAINSSGKITDRSFTITVTGNYPPQLLTSNYKTLGEFTDGIIINIPLQAVDLNSDTLTFSLLSGNLPLGTSLSSDGVISGPLIPNYVPPSGFDVTSIPWDANPWDQTDIVFPPGSNTSNYGKITYYFSIQVSDGKSFDIKNYNIVVYNQNTLTADSTLLLDDDTYFTGDTTNVRKPILLTTSLGDYSTFTSGNYFSFKFEGIDYDNVGVNYAIFGTAGSGWDLDSVAWDDSPWDQSSFGLPPGLTLDTQTGWLTGFIPPQSYVSQTYSFAIYCYSVIDNTVTSNYQIFTIDVLGALSLGITWQTNTNLGSIDTGDISQLSVSASASSGRTLYYSLASGSRIPQGLTLLNDGSISGRVSFQQFSLDKGTTTFDVTNTKNGVTTSPTTIDRTYKFIVNATDYSNSVSGQQTFTLTVNNVTYEPYDNLYLVCLPSIAKRNILSEILGNTDYFKAEDIYRPNDPYWGIQSDIKVLVGYGLTSSQASSYIAAMRTRHYNKRFYFDSYKYATATDNNNNPLYDVIYVDLVEDTKTYSNVNGYITPNIPNANFLIKDGRRLYPNDLSLMNEDLIVGIGETNSNTLPQWETSIQADGRILNFKTAAVLAYLNPGAGERVLYLLQNGVPANIKLVPFTADRYIFDNNLDTNYNISTGYYYSKQYTTFDTGYVLSVTPAATVAYGLDIPFDRVDGATINQINDIGGLDGDTSGDWDGKLVVFTTQENYNPTTFPTLYNNGWNQNGAVIPGYAEFINGSSKINRRGGVWQIGVSNRTVSLTFVQEIQLNQVVNIQFGAKANKTYQYSSLNIGVSGQTVPKYEYGNFQTLQTKAPTTFDSKNTRFINNQDQYQLPFANDSYLKFPLKNILETAT